MARDQQPLKTRPHARTKVKLVFQSLICQSPLKTPVELSFTATGCDVTLMKPDLM
jgi:hypothetical protein